MVSSIKSQIIKKVHRHMSRLWKLAKSFLNKAGNGGLAIKCCCERYP